jgi:hypothetical protein
MNTSAGAKEKAVCLLSLGSSRDPLAAAALYAKTAAERGSKLILCPLDSLEAINRRVFHGDLAGSASPYIAEACRRIEEFCCNDVSAPLYIPYSCFEVTIEFSRYLARFLDLFTTNRGFRSEVRNQTYRNLQPVLRSKGIEKKNRPVLDMLSEFLVREIALKCYLGNESIADVEYGLAPEMKLMQSICSLHYAGIADLVHRQLEFVQVAAYE